MLRSVVIGSRIQNIAVLNAGNHAGASAHAVDVAERHVTIILMARDHGTQARARRIGTALLRHGLAVRGQLHMNTAGNAGARPAAEGTIAGRCHARARTHVKTDLGRRRAHDVATLEGVCLNHLNRRGTNLDCDRANGTAAGNQDG